MPNKNFLQAKTDRDTAAYAETGLEAIGYTTPGDVDYGMTLAEIFEKQDGEYDSTNGLVYPYWPVQTVVYASDQVSTMSATYNSIVYTMTMTYTNDQVTSRVVTNDTNANTDTQTITYSDNQIGTISAWVRT